MFILDRPYVAPEQIAYLEETQAPVLDNEMARELAKDHKLNLLSPQDFAERINAGARVYTSSENALDWLCEHTNRKDLIEGIRLCKDKFEMRKRLSSLNPKLHFERLERAALADYVPAPDLYPFVLKPTVGFCSMGVYVINSYADYKRALESIEEAHKLWSERYPLSVVESDYFIIESYIKGIECALDMYYDEEGAPQILNVLRHDFANSEDTSDRLYYCGWTVMQDYYERLLTWLVQVNQVLGLKNFPIHIEVRISEDGIAPIEFNPLRFAGLGGTEISWFGFGFHTYDYYLNNKRFNWEEELKDRKDKVYAMCLLPEPEGADPAAVFDLERFVAPFDKVLACHVFDHAKVGSLAFLYLELPAQVGEQHRYVLCEDLSSYLLPA